MIGWFAAQAYAESLVTAQDAAFFKAQADKCRFLARAMDECTRSALLKLVEQYEAKAKELANP